MEELENELSMDCEILFARALKHRTVCAFGDDGCGKHGKNDRAIHFTVDGIQCEVSMIDDATAAGLLIVQLETYLNITYGDICTDQNFLISVRELLKEAGINPDAIQYASIDEQGMTYVAFEFDVGEVLQWA